MYNPHLIRMLSSPSKIIESSTGMSEANQDSSSNYWLQAFGVSFKFELSEKIHMHPSQNQSGAIHIFFIGF